MVICQSCGAERSEQDRFCRSCGVPVSVSVTELEDTRRFNPSASPTSQGAPSGFTSHFYVPPAPAYPAAPAESPVYKTASLRKKILRQKAFWVFALVLISMFTMIGVGIGMRAGRNRRVATEERTRRVTAEDLQNALGFKPGSISEAIYPPEVKGLYVSYLLTDDGPAALANIQAGDVLVELNEKPVRNTNEALQILDSMTIGAEVSAKVYREGEIVPVRVKIADRRSAPLQPKLEAREQGWLGIEDSIRRCGVPGVQKCGVQIERLEENSPADLGGLREGDVITELNGYKVRTPEEFNRRIRLTKPRTKAAVNFFRGNAEQKAELTLGYQR